MRALRFALVLCLTLLAACGGCGRSGVALPEKSHLQALVVVPDAATLYVGQRATFRAVAAFDNADPRDLRSDEITWNSSVPEIVDFEEGVAVAKSAGGPVDVTASALGLTTKATVTVSAAKPLTFDVAPARAVVPAGATLQLRATLALDDGTTLDLTAATTGTAWQSQDPARATVSADGRVTGVAAGLPVEISAKNAAFSATCLVRVTDSEVKVVSLAVRPARLVLEAGSTGAVRAVAALSDGSELDVTADPRTTWSSSSAALVVDAQGHLQALSAAAQVAVSASMEGLRAAAIVDVTESPLVAITLAPQELTLGRGTDARIVATGRYADGHVQDLSADPRLSWRSDDASTVAVEQGVVHALAAGTTTVHARLGTVEGTATVTVLPAKLTGLSLAPPEADVLLGESIPLKLLGLFDDGTTRDLSAVATGTRWDVEPPGFAHVDAQGLVHGDRVGGPVAVLASNGGFEARASVTVHARPDQLVSLRFQPSDVRVDVGQSAALHLVGTFGDGHSEDLTTAASGTVYASADRALVEVDPDGHVRGFALGGPTAITAFNRGFDATALVTVAPPPPTVVSLAVDPTAVTGKVGETTRLHVVATFSDASARDVTSASAGTTYTISGDPTVARVSADGVVTLTAAGSSAIVVQNGTARTFVTVAVAARTLVDLRIAPGRLELPVGLVDRVTVTGVFSDGTTIDLTAPETGTVYASTHANIASVDANGRVTALSVGNTQISAANGGLIRRVSARVRDAEVVGVGVSPPLLRVVAGRTFQLVCTATLDTGRLVDVTAGVSGTTYVTANPLLATVSADGLVRGVAAGHTQVSCINHGAFAATDVTVLPPVADEVRVTPAAARLPKGRILPLAVTVKFSDGTVRDASGAGSGTLYFAANPNIAPVSNDGVVVGLAEGGPVDVTALVAGSTQAVSITVVPPAVDALACVPSSISLKTAQTATFTVSATWSDGRVTTVGSADGVVFRITDPAIASVTDAGLVTGLSAGRTETFAYLGGAVARCPVEVLP